MMNGKMVGFHIDMNVAHFRRDYLEKWLRYLAGAGYNTILWEVENNIKWKTVPECVSPEAYSHDEFKEIIKLSRSLGLEPVPLLQTIGHAEYVLKHPAYAHLRELPDRIDQYCPLKDEAATLLKEWISEYLELFGDIRRFHLGADEAYVLGACEKCRSFSEKHSVSHMFVQYINDIAVPLKKKGIQPVIWCDMLLKYPEAIAELSRDIMIFDWHYSHYVGCDRPRIWGKGRVQADELDEETISRFGSYLFPGGGKELDIFYTTEYLKDKGFDVVTCPSSCAALDSVFAPALDLRERNTWDFGRRGMDSGKGMMLTSWTVRIHPWEMQKSCIDMPGYIVKKPEADIDRFRSDYCQRTFGLEPGLFYEAAELLSVKCPFDRSLNLGFYKSCEPVADDFVLTYIDEALKDGKFEKELDQAKQAREKFENARGLFAGLVEEASKGQEYLDCWIFAADALFNRAQCAVYLLTRAVGEPEGDRIMIVEELDRLESEFKYRYLKMQLPMRVEQITQWLFVSLRTALMEDVSEDQLH